MVTKWRPKALAITNQWATDRAVFHPPCLKIGGQSVEPHESNPSEGLERGIKAGQRRDGRELGLVLGPELRGAAKSALATCNSNAGHSVSALD
jgi:hypothetical protein